MIGNFTIHFWANRKAQQYSDVMKVFNFEAMHSSHSSILHHLKHIGSFLMELNKNMKETFHSGTIQKTSNQNISSFSGMLIEYSSPCWTVKNKSKWYSFIKDFNIRIVLPSNSIV